MQSRPAPWLPEFTEQVLLDLVDKRPTTVDALNFVGGLLFAIISHAKSLQEADAAVIRRLKFRIAKAICDLTASEW